MDNSHCYKSGGQFCYPKILAIVGIFGYRKYLSGENYLMVPSLPIGQSSLYQIQDLVQSPQNSASLFITYPSTLQCYHTTSTQQVLLNSGSLQEILILEVLEVLSRNTCFIDLLRLPYSTTVGDLKTALEVQNQGAIRVGLW